MAMPDIPLPGLTEHGRQVGEWERSLRPEGLFAKPGSNAADTMDSISAEHPYIGAAGALGSMGIGGLPAFFEGASKKILQAIGKKTGGAFGAMMTAPKAAIAAQAAQKALGAGATGLATGAVEDTARAADEALRHPEAERDPWMQRLVSEAEKLAIQTLLTGGTGALFGAIGARGAQNLDPATNAGSGGTAQQMLRLKQAGGKTSLGGVVLPESAKPIYAEAMAGGEKIPRVGDADVVPDGATPEIAEIFQAKPNELTKPGLDVRDVAAEKALGPLQRGIAKADKYTGSIAEKLDNGFYGTETARDARVFPKTLASKMIEFIKNRTYKDQTAIAYTNSGEPIEEMNKLCTVGDPVSSAEAAAAVRRNPQSHRMKVSEAIASGFTS